LHLLQAHRVLGKKRDSDFALYGVSTYTASKRGVSLDVLEGGHNHSVTLLAARSAVSHWSG
jgi:hypothetical protein